LHLRVCCRFHFARARVLYEPAKPVQRFGKHILNRFPRGVTVGLTRQSQVADRAGVSLERAVYARLLHALGGVALGL